MRLLIFIIFIHFSQYTIVYGQEVLESDNILNPLKVGDTVPEYKLVNMINFPTKITNISDFKDKLVILDFWDESCSACIASWPKLIKLQSQFKDEIQIILVNPWKDESTVKRIFERREKLTDQKITLASTNGDIRILNLFPLSGLPHIVWINKNGVIESITSGNSVNEKNIGALINSEKLTMPQKIGNNEYIKWERSYTLYADGNGGESSEIYGSSILAKASGKLYPGLGIYINHRSGKYYAAGMNVGVDLLYSLAYSNQRKDFDHGSNISRLLPIELSLEMKNPERYLTFIDGEIQPDNLYGYQLRYLCPVTPEKIQEDMRIDLKRYFGLSANWERRIRKCLVLRAQDSTKISYLHGERSLKMDISHFIINKITITEFIQSLVNVIPEYGYKNDAYFLVDDTGFKGKLRNIEFEGQVGKFKELNEVLKKYKMSFTPEEREIDVLVLTEPEDYIFPFNGTLSDEQKFENERMKALVKVANAQNREEWMEYKRLAVDYVNMFLMKKDLAFELNEYATRFCQNEFLSDSITLKEALKWSKRAIEINYTRTQKESYNFSYTYVMILYKLGFKEIALKEAYKTLELAGDIKWAKDQTLALIERILKLDN